MIFRYLEITPTILRPVIPIILKAGNKFVLYSALIDSGADHCIFDIEIAKSLGTPLQPKKINLKGLSREKVNGYLGKVELNINGTSYDIFAIFAPIGDFAYGILGQKGFFDRFDVKLSYNKQIIELESITNKN